MKKVEKAVLHYLQERGWDNLRPSDLAKSISIEAAELLEIFQWTSMSLEDTKKDPAKMEALKKELADVFLYAFDMAVLLGVDTEQIILEKLEHVKKKYPAHLMKNRKKEPGTEDAYLKIKKQYRMKGL